MASHDRHIHGYLSGVDEGIIIGSVVGGSLGIIMVIILCTHMIHECIKKRCDRTVSKNTFIKTKQGTLIMAMTYTAFALYLISLISMTFLRTSAILGDGYTPNTLCTFTWFASYPLNGYAKLMIWNTFLYRLYVSFRATADPVSKKLLICVSLFLWIFCILLTVIAFIIISNHDPFIEVYTADHHIAFCGAPNQWPPGFTQILVAILAVEFIMNVYTLYAFVSRLYRVRKEWLRQLAEESNMRAQQKQLSVNEIHRMISCNTYNIESTMQYTNRILKLTRLIMKLNYLLLLTLISGWIYLGFSLYRPIASMLYGYDVIVNIVCLWFLLGLNENKWNMAVHYCYYPCCCHALCPTIRKPMLETTKQPQFIQVKTTSTASPVMASATKSPSVVSLLLMRHSKTKTKHILVDDDEPDNEVIQALDGYKYTKHSNGMEANIESTGRVCLYGTITQCRQMEGFFDGNIAQIVDNEALPVRRVTKQVTAVCNEYNYCVSISIATDGMISAQCSLNYMNINAFRKQFNENRDVWYLLLGFVNKNIDPSDGNPYGFPSDGEQQCDEKHSYSAMGWDTSCPCTRNSYSAILCSISAQYHLQ
eukprot:18274_1